MVWNLRLGADMTKIKFKTGANAKKSLIILPSNQHRNIDLDLVLIQQSRRITNSLQKIDTEISSCPLKWYSLSQKSKIFLKNFVSQYKQYFIKKFNWLYNKQFTQINKLKCANKTSIKIKKRCQSLQD